MTSTKKYISGFGKHNFYRLVKNVKCYFIHHYQLFTKTLNTCRFLKGVTT